MMNTHRKVEIEESDLYIIKAIYKNLLLPSYSMGKN